MHFSHTYTRGESQILLSTVSPRSFQPQSPPRAVLCTSLSANPVLTMPSDTFYLRADIPSTTPQPDDAQGYLDAVAYPIFPIPSSSRLFPQSSHHRHPDPFQVSNNMNETGQYGYPAALSWASDCSDWHPDYVSFDGSLPNHNESTLSYYGNITYDNHMACRHDLLDTNNSATLDGCGSVASSSGTSDSDYGMSNPAPSFTASAHFANDALISGTLHQYACTKQRRSRHDPGGGFSPYGLPETPQIGAYHDIEPLLHHHSEPLPIASPHSSALFGAVHDVTSPHPQRAPARPQARRLAETKQATTYHPPSPTELPSYGDWDESNRQDGTWSQ
ncbi:hypothetical protein BXZ70DRAFT_303345 [Cristinia sonorae]|uniref:Uncharacterized protein n=1 Tax=Cristinia sonorae TaxID=1940300 RepID=A0A8K0ULZ7_9AGAR|nr:hypothetical protein BXZ70DRAFT_303345 [Cristinia sonorae]